MRESSRETLLPGRPKSQGDVIDKTMEGPYSTIKAEFTFESIEAELFTDGETDLVSV